MFFRGLEPVTLCTDSAAQEDAGGSQVVRQARLAHDAAQASEGTSVTPGHGGQDGRCPQVAAPLEEGPLRTPMSYLQSAAQAFDQVRLDLIERDAYLLHRVRNSRMVTAWSRVEVVGDAEGR